MGKWCDCFRDDLVDDINVIVDNSYDPEQLSPLDLSSGSGSSVDEEEVAATMHSMIHPSMGMIFLKYYLKHIIAGVGVYYR